RLGHHLHDALVVPKVDEAQAAEVAGDVRPAAEGDGLADQGFIDQAAKMGTHEDSGQWPRRRAESRSFYRLAGRVPRSAAGRPARAWPERESNGQMHRDNGRSMPCTAHLPGGTERP